MAQSVLYRLRCGHRAWSRWFSDEDQAWDVALEKGLADQDTRGRISSAPLVWIEKGLQAYPKRKVVPMTSELDGKPLRPRYVNPLPPR